MSSTILLSWVGWYYIPNFATRHTLHFIHSTVFPSLRLGPPPPPGTVAYRDHWRYTYSLVVLSYLGYNLYQSASDMPPNFYQIMQVPSDVDEDGLKAAFRHFARHNHPDRVGEGGAELFMKVRDVFDALKNPNVRFAYDRFGPDVLEWKNLSTQREYLKTGLTRSVGFHIVSLLGLLGLSSVGRSSPVAYWRYIILVGLFAMELSLLLAPSPSPQFSSIFDPGSNKTWLHAIFPERVAFQHILFLHQFLIFLTNALTNLGPQLFPDDSVSKSDALLDKFTAMAGAADREASMMLHGELYSVQLLEGGEERVGSTRVASVGPAAADPFVLDRVRVKMEEMIIEKNLTMEGRGPLRSAWEKAVALGRAAAAAAKSSTDALPPSPISPTDDDVDESVLHSSWTNSHGRLPSPRPSPPPPPSLQRKASSFTRARSVSY